MNGHSNNLGLRKGKGEKNETDKKHHANFAELHDD